MFLKIVCQSGLENNDVFPSGFRILEWLNDNGSIYVALLGPEYFQGGVRATIQGGIFNHRNNLHWMPTSMVTVILTEAISRNLAVNFGCTENCIADIDGNGVVDENDLIVIR